MFQTILFDLDGTLIDSEADIAASVNVIRARAGLPDAPLTEVRAAIGDGVRVLLERMLPTVDDAAVEAYVEHQEAHCLDRTRLYESVRQGLADLSKRAVLAVVSNKPTHLCVKILRGLDALPYFRCVIGGDTPAGRKPAPGPFTSAFESVGRAPWDAIALGDSAGDLTAARAAGCAAVAAMWGYRPAEELRASSPDAEFARFEDFARSILDAPVNVYEALGRETFFTIARAFYNRIDKDPRLRAMFPKDLEPAIERQALFLMQFFGGPSLYSEKRGAPRLRIRHAEFPITGAASEAWLDNMRGALDESVIAGAARGILDRYLVHTARFLVNTR